MQYVELVPRELDQLLENAKFIMATHKNVTGINIPDVVRLPHRSHDAAALLLDNGISAIPHIRCIDRQIQETVDLINPLVSKGLQSVLLISGDYPVTPSFQIYPIKVTEVVTAVKKAFPTLNVYCGIDPYRQSFIKEFQYIQEKLNAGADGFFTQPFFETSLAELYLDKCKNTQLFVGSSPVITEKSLNYWITRNHVVFPSDFDTSLDYNCKLGKTLIQLSEQYQQHSYTMPIKIELKPFLAQLFT